MIRVEKLTFRHPHTRDPVVKEVSFEVPEGNLAVLLGPNGSGKTTLFKSIAGLWPPDSGQVMFDGRDIVQMSYKERAAMLAVVPQDHTPPFPYSVFEAVLMGRAPHVGLYAAPAETDEEAAYKALMAVGIEHLAERCYTRISGGERQMVLIARALAQEAPLLLLDEPTSHLDFRNQHLVLETVRQVATDKGLTVLMTLHDPNLAAYFAHQVIMLKGGSIVADGVPSLVLNEGNLAQLYNIGIGIFDSPDRRLIYPRTT
jgi:iron complex transport system ATP-binding protein